MNQILLKNVINILSQVVDLLYQENLQSAYISFAAVLPKLEELLAEISDQEIQNVLVEKLQAILETMESQDSILLADMLQYELMEQLTGLLEDKE